MCFKFKTSQKKIKFKKYIYNFKGKFITKKYLSLKKLVSFEISYNFGFNLSFNFNFKLK